MNTTVAPPGSTGWGHCADPAHCLPQRVRASALAARELLAQRGEGLVGRQGARGLVAAGGVRATGDRTGTGDSGLGGSALTSGSGLGIGLAALDDLGLV